MDESVLTQCISEDQFHMLTLSHTLKKLKTPYILCPGVLCILNWTEQMKMRVCLLSLLKRNRAEVEIGSADSSQQQENGNCIRSYLNHVSHDEFIHSQQKQDSNILFSYRLCALTETKNPSLEEARHHWTLFAFQTFILALKQLFSLTHIYELLHLGILKKN